MYIVFLQSQISKYPLEDSDRSEIEMPASELLKKKTN